MLLTLNIALTKVNAPNHQYTYSQILHFYVNSEYKMSTLSLFVYDWRGSTCDCEYQQTHVYNYTVKSGNCRSNNTMMHL